MRTELRGVIRAPWRVGPAILCVLLVVLPLPILFASLFLGRKGLSPGVVVGAFVGTVEPTVRKLVLHVRLPRAVAAAIVGADLAVAGAAFQGIFHNPLMESRILGVSAGAGLGAALAMVLRSGPAGVQSLAFAGGLSAAWLAASLGAAFGGGLLVLVLSGILMNSFFSALLGLIKYFADPYVQLPGITFWLMGGLPATLWKDVIPLAITSGVGLVLLFLLSWKLNLLTLSEAEAQALGLPVRRLRLFVIALGTLLTAAAVSVSGVVGWVGLIVPHAARALVGPNHVLLIPASAGLGAATLLLLDNVARTAFATEIPLDILTGILGVPLFFLLFMRQVKRGGGWR